jgi:hypothetical protein
MEEFTGKGKRLFAILNASPDPVSPVVKIGGKVTDYINSTVLEIMEKPFPVSVKVKKDNNWLALSLNYKLAYLGILVIEIK